jgi:TetR/AcrR family transcriptional regulator, cholesterol catabolism regulator
MEQGLIEGLHRTEQVVMLGLPAEERLLRLIRTQLGTILEDGNDFIPVLLYDWRSLTAANRRRIVALKDRYDALWQSLIDELHAAGRINVDPKMARLLILGAVNWAGTWYKRGGRLSLDAVAADTTRLFLHNKNKQRL